MLVQIQSSALVRLSRCSRTDRSILVWRSHQSRPEHNSMSRIAYSYQRPGGMRRHYLVEQDIEVLLGRLPSEVWARLRAVHFNDRGFGVRCLGYVNRSHREIALGALPPRVSLERFQPRRSPRLFGALRGASGPRRRFGDSCCTTYSFTSWGIFRLSILGRTWSGDGLPARPRPKSLRTSGVRGCGLSPLPTPTRFTTLHLRWN